MKYSKLIKNQSIPVVNVGFNFFRVGSELESYLLSDLEVVS